MNDSHLSPILISPIATLDQAKAWIQELHDKGMMFHFDDSTHDIGNTINGQWVNLWSESDALIISQRRDELYSEAFDWSPHDCPIGFALHIMGHCIED